MVSTIVRLLTRRRIFFVTGGLLLTGLSAIFASRLGIDNSLDVWFVDDDPTLLSYHHFLEQFGNDEVVVAALHGTESALEANRLARLATLTERISAIDGVARVRSLATLPVVDRRGPTPRVTTVIDPPVDNDDVARARETTSRDGIAAMLVGHDGHTLLLYIWMETGPELETERSRILDEIRAATETTLDVNRESASYGGLGVVYDALNRSTLRDGALFIMLSYAMMFIVLYLIMRRLTWVLLAMAAVTCADIGLFGVMALLDRPVNMITMALPPLVMILGVANTVHMATDLDIALSRNERESDALGTRLAESVTPCFFNAVTTAVAFLSLTTASMAVTRDYGRFAAVGVILAFVFSVIAITAVLPRVPRYRAPGRLKKWMANLAERGMRISARRRAWVVGASIGILVLAVWGATRIEVDTYSIDFLPKNHVVRSDSDRIEARAGAYVPLELTVSPLDTTSWWSVRFLHRVAAAQMAVEADPSVDRTTTILDAFRDAHIALTGDVPERPWVPASDDESRRLAAIVDAASGRAGFTGFVSHDQRAVRITATTPMASVRTFTDVGDRVLAAANDAVSGQAQVATSGYLPLYGQMIAHILDDQLRSFGLAFLMVFIVVFLVLRSWRLTVAAIPPNLLPVAIMLGAMGFIGIRLDIATVTIAAVVLGVIVDDTVHILYRLKRAIAAGYSTDEAISRVARGSGVAVISTSIVFSAGFLVVAMAGTYSIANVGLLTAIAVFAALVTDLTLLPAFVSYLYGGTHDD